MSAERDPKDRQTVHVNIKANRSVPSRKMPGGSRSAPSEKARHQGPAPVDPGAGVEENPAAAHAEPRPPRRRRALSAGQRMIIGGVIRVLAIVVFAAALVTMWRFYRYSRAESANHVANRAAIQISQIQETANLEVLNASVVVYDIEQDSNQSWLEVPGTGVFTVDLAAGEYICDNDRGYVLAKVPAPELTNITTIYGDIKVLLYDDKWTFRNGDIRSGEEQANKQVTRAESEMRMELKSNQAFDKLARTTAKSLIEDLIRNLNGDIPDLTVDVQFMS